jgi:hypothetical protein
MSRTAVDRPVRVGVFSTVEQAERAVNALFTAGFRREQISVLCSDEHKERLFGRLAHPVHTARQTRQAIATGGVIGAALGGLALAATAIVTGGASLLAAGTVLVGGGAFAGSFTGAMLTRGFEKEIADYYDAAVRVGKVLVAVEVEGEGHEARLAQAERILAEAGAEPVPLVEG